MPYGIVGPQVPGYDYAVTYHDRTLLSNLKPRLVVSLFGMQANMPGNSGTTMEWRRVTPFVPTWAGNPTSGAGGAAPIASNFVPYLLTGDPTEDARFAALVEGEAPLEGEYNIESVSNPYLQVGNWRGMTDRIQYASFDDHVAIMLAEQSFEAAAVADLTCQNALLAGQWVAPNSKVDPDAILAGDQLTNAELDTAILLLKEAWAEPITSWLDPNVGQGTVPGRPAYVGFVRASQTAYLRANITGWEDAETYRAGNVLLPNEVGKYKDIRFCESGLGLWVQNATGVMTEITPIIAQDAFGRGMIVPGGSLQALVRRPNQPAPGDELGQTGSVGWKMDYGAVVLEQARVVTLGWTQS